jgi:hypothetical protein
VSRQLNLLAAKTGFPVTNYGTGRACCFNAEHWCTVSGSLCGFLAQLKAAFPLLVVRLVGPSPMSKGASGNAALPFLNATSDFTRLRSRSSSWAAQSSARFAPPPSDPHSTDGPFRSGGPSSIIWSTGSIVPMFFPGGRAFGTFFRFSELLRRSCFLLRSGAKAHSTLPIRSRRLP